MSDIEDLERAFLACFMNSIENARKLRRAVKPQCLTTSICRRAYSVGLRLLEKNDEPTVANIVIEGGFSPSDEVDLTGIQVMIPNVSPEVIARKLVEKIITQRALGLHAKIDRNADAFDLVRHALEFTQDAASLIRPLESKSKTDSLADYQEHLLANAGAGVKRIPTGLATLDRMLGGGLSPGNLSYLGGMPGSGKTSFALQLAIYAARCGHKVTVLEGEMPLNEIYERANGILTGAPVDEIRAGNRFNDLSREAIAELYSLPLEFHEVFDRNPLTIQAEIQSAAAEGAELIVLDYLQVFSGRGKQASDEFYMTKKLSETLRQLALQHFVHLLVLSSVNRNERQDKLSLHSFFGSSGLGHDASLAILLIGKQRDEAELVSGERQLTLKVVKNRSGVRGELNLQYHLRCQRMEELTLATKSRAFESSDDGEEEE